MSMITHYTKENADSEKKRTEFRKFVVSTAFQYYIDNSKTLTRKHIFQMYLFYARKIAQQVKGPATNMII